MLLTRMLQIVLAAIAALGTVLLSMGQRDVVMPLVMILAAGASLWLTDFSGLLRLNRTVANVAMLLAALVSLSELSTYRGEIQALGFARLLMYLQIIVLFQKKDARNCWLLIMLSLLQVVVAALFSQGVIFGLMLIFYMLLTSLGLTLLLFQRQWDHFSAKEIEKPLPAVPLGRWPLANQQSELTGFPAGDIHLGIGAKLYGRLTGIGLRSLGVMAVLFVFLPRFGQMGWIGTIVQTMHTVGFTDRVNLGELGQIIDNPDEVMRIRFFDHATNAPYPVHGAIYLRGAVLMDYRRGQWQVGKPAFSLGNATVARSYVKSLPPKLVRQECTIEGLDRPELFYVAPFVPIKSYVYIAVDDARLRLLRADHIRNQRFPYIIGTTALVNGMQLPLVPRDEREDRYIAPLRLSPPDEPNTLPNVVRLAQEWIEESNLPEEDRAGRARYLSRKLESSGMFRYSLQPQDRDPDIDPIEDFLTKHRAGHCEYFASALTLMLRSQNIPARVVVGYRTDEWNQIGECFQVRQLHAHTWVECFLRPGQIPPELLHGGDYWPWAQNGAWLQLDPTPESTADAQTSWFTSMRNTLQWFNYVWSYYVVELNYERQRNAIFQPIAVGAKTIFQWLTDPETWRNIFMYVRNALHLSGLPGAIAWVLLITAGLAGAALLGLLTWLLWRLAVSLWRRLSGRSPKRRDAALSEVAFYRRLEILLAAHSLIRRAGQTQREFARMAGLELAAISGQKTLVQLPLCVADAFYRVRFGRAPLDNAQHQAVEQALDQIAACHPPRSNSP